MFRKIRKHGWMGILPFLAAGLLCLPSVSPAAVREVTLFPDSARVEETVKIDPQSAGATINQVILVLPSQADPESLTVSPSSAGRVKIDDIRIKSIARVDENRIAQLRAQLKKAQNEKKELQARLKALDIQIQFWQAQTKAKTKTVSEAATLASAIGRNSLRIFSEKNAGETDMENIDKQIKEIQENLDRAAGKSEKAWEATVTLSGTPPRDALLIYSYTLGGCGWQPLYRMEALPSSASVLFSWDAEIWQSTGEEWKMAQIYLATLQPVRTIAPPELPPWIIKPKAPVIYKSMQRETAAQARLSMEETNDLMAAGASAPVETVRTTYSVWSLGKKTVAPGDRQRLKIKEETWPAQFLFLARPSLSPQAYLQAHIQLPGPAEIPSGEATFAIDGAIIGKRPFALAGSEADIYFGNSPFVTVSSLTVADQSGGAKFFSNKQTRRWQWRLEAKNTGNTPVKLRIEEPIPQARDERIKLTFKQQPEPSEKSEAAFVWLVELPALQKKNIETGVELEAPQDMALDFGWRR
ncbi:MAG: mucoidy inhibitor MuiA family protein [Smithella sp.]|nr:mucoidy inhibitor MuiA family protein [Smithella sp.]